MNIKSLFNTTFPHFTAVLVFILIGVFYFQPVLDGKDLRKGDTIKALGYKKEITDFRKSTGEDPLWTNSMFGGMPAYQMSVKYKSSFLGNFKRIMEFNTPSPIKYLVLYMLGFYILLISLRINPWLSIGGAIAYAFSTYFIIIIGAGHIWKVNALAFMPPALAGILMCYRGKYLWGAILACFFLSMELYSNHIQMTYYFLLTVICILIFEFYSKFKSRELKKFFIATAFMSIAALLALGINNTNLYSTYQYGKQSIRGESELTIGNENNKTSGLDKDYATAWSYGIEETLSLLIPNTKGGANGYMMSSPEALENIDSNFKDMISQQDHYWGNQPFTAGPVYVGAIILFLFFLGLSIVKGPLKNGLLAATILAIMLSWGHNFMPLTDFFLDYIPLYNKFRVVSSILVVVELCMPLLAFLALKKVFEKPEILLSKINVLGKNINVLILPLLFSLGVALVLYILPDTFLNFLSQREIAGFDQYRHSQPEAVNQINLFVSNLTKARVHIFKADALRSSIFIILALATLIAFAYRKINKNIFIVILIALIFIDLYPINTRYVNSNNFVPKKDLKIAFQPTNGDVEILRMEMKNNPSLGNKIRNAQQKYKHENPSASQLELLVLAFSVNNQNSDYRVFNKSVNTFNNTSTSYYHKSIGGYHGAKMRRYQEIIEHHIAKGNKKVLNMLNTKYIIKPSKEKSNAAMLNTSALGEAWLVNTITMVDNADAELMALNVFDPAKEILVDKRFESIINNLHLEKDTTASIKQISYAPNKIVYESNASKAQVAVFSEIYYKPGWQAYIDGIKAEHFRANYILRAMIIPEGKRTITFRFQPKAFYACEKISVASMIISFIIFLVALVFSAKKIFLKQK